MTETFFAKNSILQCIGNTPIVKIHSPLVSDKINFFGKCEFMNPSGSIKDRIALFMIEEAEKKGEIKKGYTIIESTSGNTGQGLAMVAAQKGYKCIFVMSDKQSKEKQVALKALGAELIMCPTDVEPDDPRSYYSVAKKLSKEIPNSFYKSQYFSEDNPRAHYHSTGPEIWKQCGNNIDYLVVGLGTGGTMSGTAKYLKEKNPQIKIIGVDPIGSIFYDLFYKEQEPKAHTYLLEGVGEDFLPPAIDMSLLDDIVQVSDKEGLLMARNALRSQGILCGGSSGAAIFGANKYFANKTFDKIPNVLIILPDAANRYYSKHLNDDWMTAQNFI